MTIDIVLWLQQFDHEIFKLFFNFISFLGEEYVYIVVIGVIYYTVDKETGRFLAFSLFTSAGLNGLIKGIVKAPRPYQEYGDLIENLRPETSGGYSFPSGHNQSFGTFLTSIALLFKKRYLYYIGGVLLVLMMISRMYLGVHYLEDVVVGALFGIAVSIVLFLLFRKFYTYKKRMTLYITVTLLLIPFLFFVSYDQLFKSVGMLVGFALAYWFEEKYVRFSMQTTTFEKIIRVIIGLSVMVLIQAGGSALFSLFAEEGTTLMNILDLFRYFLISFIGLGVIPSTFKYLKKGDTT